MTPLELHKQYSGKIGVTPKVEVNGRDELSWVYTPGVGSVSTYLSEHPEETNDYTMRGNFVAVVSDGSAVLGLGNIGPEGAYPVMEGKALLFKKFAGIDAVPIVLSTQDPDKIIAAVEAIAPTFAGINLEDIAAPACFYIEDELRKRLGIPVIHDDQWGTAVIVLAGLINASKVVGKNIKNLKVILSGAGAAATATTRLLLEYGIKDITLVDSKGALAKSRTDLNDSKKEILALTNPQDISGHLAEVLIGADCFIGLSAPGILHSDDIVTMAADPIVFALANPTPEIMPDLAKAGGAAVVATGRSDFPNQLNNALAFPGIFQGLLSKRIRQVTTAMLTRAAEGLASKVAEPTAERIIPSIFEEGVAETVAAAIE